jgi:sugar lactone lactonase YvrE
MRNLLLLISLIFCSCEKLYVSQDLINDNIFKASAVEGPAVDKAGNLYAVNFEKNGTIGIVKNGKANLFVNLPESSTGNGIRFNSKEEMFIADYTGHNVLKLNLRSKTVSVFAHDSSMNQPNDICITNDDYIFASDPNWKESSGNIWRISPNGEIIKLDSLMGTTNGIEVDPTNSILYVNESVQRKVWAYDLDKNRNISNKRLFTEFPDFGSDGMRCDSKGNLYIARYGKGVIEKYNPKAKLFQTIKLKGKCPSNIAFGGKDGRTAFVTMHKRGAIETFRVETPGRAWTMMHQN